MATQQEELAIFVRLKDFATAEFNRLRGVVVGFGNLGVSAFRGLTGAVFSLKGALAGLGVALTVKGIAGLIKSTADEADQLRDLSIALGISTEDLSELKFAAGQAGASFEELVTGLRTFQKGLGEVAATGKGQAAEALRLVDDRIIETVRNGGSLVDALVQVSEGFKRLSAQEKVFAASKLFGRSGPTAMIPVLTEDLEQLMATARRFGITLSREAADSADAFNDSLGELSGALKGLRNSVILPLLPDLTNLVKAITAGLVDKRPEIIGFFADLTETVGKLGTIAGQTFAGITQAVLGVQRGITGVSLRLATDELSYLTAEHETLNETIKNSTTERETWIQVQKNVADLLVAQREKVTNLERQYQNLDAAIESSGKLLSGDFERGAKLAAARIRELALGLGNTREAVQSGLGRDIDREFDQILEGIAKTTPAIRELTGTWEDFLRERRQLAREARVVLEEFERIRNLESITRGARLAFSELRAESRQWGEATRNAILGVSNATASNLTDSILDFATGAKTAKEAVKDFARSSVREIGRVIIQTLILKAVQAGIGGLFGGVGSTASSVTSQAEVSTALSQPGVLSLEAKGTVFDRPTFFSGGGRRGLMAEAGIEGLFPLARDPQGRLAVRAVGGRGGPSQQITIGPINIYSKRDRNEEDAREILAVVAQGMRSKSTFREAME